MSDQASQLRQLVLRAARLREAGSLPPPRIAAVVSARRGMGTTTVAAQLGRALVEQGARVVLVDADLNNSDLARASGVEVPVSYAPSTARHDIHESLVRASGGLQIVPGVWEGELETSLEKDSQQLLRQFQQLGRHADLLVLDLGAARPEVLRAWRDAIETFLVVTTPASAPVMDAYTLIKQSLVGRAGRGVELVVNRAIDARIATDVFQRLDRSCQRFLGFGIQLAGHLPPQGSADCLAAIAARLCEPRSEHESRRMAN